MTVDLTFQIPRHIQGIQFWAASFCRSTLGFYEALAEALDMPYRVCLARGGIGARAEIGFQEAEFAHLNIEKTEDETSAARALIKHSEWLQIFGTYQTTPHLQTTLATALKLGVEVGIASEAPCNMEPPGLRRIAKTAYLKYVLPRRVAYVTEGARFILNWSGDSATALTAIGWPPGKIVPLGYFPPPLPGTTFRPRSATDHKPFRILCSSALTWHRGPDLLIEALTLLQAWGVSFEAEFTGEGPLDAEMRARVADAGLPVRFLGRVPMKQLTALYEDCSVFVAPGRQEPWGIRVNDALNAGAPIVVSRGMGSVKLVEDYNIGVSFAAGDVTDLAWQLRRLATDQGCYLKLSASLVAVQEALKPRAAAARAALHISNCLTSESISRSSRA